MYMSLTEFPQVQALSFYQKLELLDEIWKSVSEDPSLLAVTQHEKDLLDQRWKGYLQSPESALTVDQFKQKLNTLRS